MTRITGPELYWHTLQSLLQTGGSADRSVSSRLFSVSVISVSKTNVKCLNATPFLFLGRAAG